MLPQQIKTKIILKLKHIGVQENRFQSFPKIIRYSGISKWQQGGGKAQNGGVFLISCLSASF